MTVYASEAELETYLGEDAPPKAAKLLRDASSLIDSIIVGGYIVTGGVIETKAKDALRDATCAQVEWWVEAGDPSDSMHKFDSVSTGSFSATPSGRRLAPRAADHLFNGGLLNRAVATT